LSLAVSDNAYLVRDILSGKSSHPRLDTVAKLADKLGVEVNDLMERAPAPKSLMVPLVGYVGAGSEAHFYAAADPNLDMVEAPPGGTPETVAAEIRGTSLGPLFERWLIYYDDVRTPVTPDLYNRLCICGLPDERVLVKQLKPAGQPNYFHLLSNAEPPIFDQEVMWAARVRNMAPR
jgi:hypothetical protein